MKVLKKRKFIILISSLIAIILVAYLSYGTVASWLTKETLQSSVEISLLLQGDEADIYESPVTLTSKGTYELAEIGTKDKDGNYVGNDVGEGKLPEPSRTNHYDYVMPGVNIPKDPKVFITKKSGAPAYLYIEVFEHNFPEFFTEDGFVKLEVDNSEQNTNEVKPIYYDLEDYWTPVYTAEGNHAVGVNGGALYVYYNSDGYFENYNKEFPITVKNGAEEQIFNRYATCLSSYIMKTESAAHIKKDTYFGINEVKKDTNGNDKPCPYFNILKNDTIYVSEKYIHSEYYSTLSSTVGNPGSIKSEGSDYDFGLYFFSYMASAKINGKYANPFEAFSNAGFISEKEYLIEQYRANDENPENIPSERILYVWAEHTYMDNGKERLGLQEAITYIKNNQYKNADESIGKYKIVMMDSFDITQTVLLKDFSYSIVIDMNGKTISSDLPTKSRMFDFKGTGNSVTIRGNGTFDMRDTIPSYMMMCNCDVTIENGNFIRDYNPGKDSSEAGAFNGCIQAGQDANVKILGGYFDNGYWDISGDINKSYFRTTTNPNKLLPVYDTENGNGWLYNEDGTYLYVDSEGNFWRRIKDDDGNWLKDENGIAVYKQLVVDSDFKAYVRDKDENGNWIKKENGEYSLRVCESNNYSYGPCPRGLGIVVGCAGNGKMAVYGGNFVGGNPAWGDELCVQDYIDNPFSGMYCSSNQGALIYGQLYSNTAPFAISDYRELPDGYKIIETNTTYSYVDENGETQTFYVPVYTVNYTGEIPN